ncbi:hypothetical protein MKW98_008235 [Papaver atlanticum]|uniref:Uncharacterized protein n=1 Tax=Papaver atlanticum TaxID=357466 RepID=A0AAD4RWG2_9MAGN|nr:hypothetical protein MKW98_008235 [Papaver atlanticum]
MLCGIRMFQLEHLLVLTMELEMNLFNLQQLVEMFTIYVVNMNGAIFYLTKLRNGKRPRPARIPDIFPQFSWMKTPLPPQLSADPPQLQCNNTHYTLLEYDLRSNAPWSHMNSSDVQNLRQEHLRQAKKYAAAITTELILCCPLGFKETARNIASPKQGSLPDCLLFVCNYMKIRMKNNPLEKKNSYTNGDSTG